MLPPPVSLLLSRLSGLAATEPTLSFLHFFRFPPVSPPFPARRLQLFCGFLRFFASLPPSPILFSFPLSSSPFPSPLLQSSLPSPFPSPFPSGVRVRVPNPVPVPVPVLRSSVHFHPRSRSRSVPVPVCVCVFSSNLFWTSGACGRTSRGHTEGRSHRIAPPSFCAACLMFFCEKDSAVPFPRREVEFCLLMN